MNDDYVTRISMLTLQHFICAKAVCLCQFSLCRDIADVATALHSALYAPAFLLRFNRCLKVDEQRSC